MSQLKEHYQAQNTEALMEIAKGDLTEVAKTTLRQVLQERGVSNEEVEIVENLGATSRTNESKKEERLASLGKRLLAFFIDFLGVYIVTLAVALPIATIDRGHAAILSQLILFGYLLLRDGIPGQSIGKRLLKIRVVHAESDKPCTWFQSIIRNLCHIVFLIDLLFALGEKRRRIGDVAANTIVINKLQMPNPSFKRDSGLALKK